MVGKRQEKRADLKARLLKCTIARIQKDGMRSLRARDLAQDAGCALGAIYNIYNDLDELVFYAKVEVFRNMEESLAEVMQEASHLPPLDQLRMLTSSYLDFANNNTNLWSALFTGDLTDRHDVPDWYQEALQRLMGYISGPLKQVAPNQTDEELSLNTRTLFSAVHGVILLTIQDRPSGVGHEELEPATGWVIESAVNYLKFKYN